MFPVKRIIQKYWFFVFTFLYLEIFFHIYMDLDLKYLPVYGLFAIVYGAFFGCICRLFKKKKTNYIVSSIVIGITCLLYVIEMMCKIILAQYFQLLSVAGTAANNHLTDYKATIFNSIWHNFFGIIFMFLPLILHLFVVKHYIRFKRANKQDNICILGTMLASYVLAWLVMHINFGGAFKPIELYRTDMEVEAQVNQLGVMTMLKQDIVHSIFGVSYDTTIKQDELDKINKDFNFGVTTTPKPTSGASEGQDPSEPMGTPTPTPTPIDTSPNVLNIDFNKVDGNDSVKWLNAYFDSTEPTKKNEYTGMFKGYNVIFITAEGFDGYVVDKDRFPTLYKLVNEGFVFNNFYNTLHYASTTNGECQNLLGLYPKNGEPQTLSAIGDNGLSMPFTLANQLNKLGYYSVGYHLNGNMYNRAKSHPLLGYNWYDKNSDLLEMERVESGGAIWPQSDRYLVEQTFDYYCDKEPFNVYYMTISGHLGYHFDENYIAWRNRDLVKDLPYGETTRGYLACHYEVEAALKLLMEKLEEKGLAERTVIVMAGDHVPYVNMEVIEELAGKKFGSSESNGYVNEGKTDLEVYKSSLIIWSGSMKEPIPVDKLCDSVDILPTVCNLLGLDYDSRVYAGRDILDSSDPGFAVSVSRCWWTDYAFYNVNTGTFKLKDGVTMSEDEKKEYIEAMNLKASYTLKITSLIQDTNYYSKLSW